MNIKVGALQQPCTDAAGFDQTEDQNFSVDKVISHVARKGNFKSRGGGNYVKAGWWTKVKKWIEGSNADSRYHRAAYESAQRLSVSLCAEEHKASAQNHSLDNLGQSKRLKNRFFTQDNLRFRPEYANEEYGLSSADKRATRCATWARRLNGLTELGAAPTGMLLKIGKNFLTPHANDKAGRNQFRVFMALPAIAYLVSGISSLIFSEPSKKIFSKVKETIREDVIALAGCFSVIAAITSLGSLIATAIGTMSAAKTDLTDNVMSRLSGDRDRHFNRLFLLLSEANGKPGAKALLSKALAGKIPASYRNESGVPVLLERLLDVVEGGGPKRDVIIKMKRVVGGYSTEKSIHGDRPGAFLCDRNDSRELLRRENHCVALTNLIEHVAIDSDSQQIYKDARHHVEDAVLGARNGTLKAAAWVAGVTGCTRLKDKLNANASDQAGKNYSQARSDPLNVKSRRFSTENMIDNRHQYGPVTRALIGTAEVLRLLNHSILLSMNFQVTRPIAWLTGRLTEGVLAQPNSRTTSFSVGRFFASCAWATIDALLLVSLAAGKGVGLEGKDLPVRHPFPWFKASVGPIKMAIGVTSTAAQMLLLATPIAVILGVTKLVARMEGWAGDVSKPLPNPRTGREVLQWQ